MNIKDKIVLALDSVRYVVVMFAYLIWFHVLALCRGIHNIICGQSIVFPGDWSADTAIHKKRRGYEEPD